MFAVQLPAKYQVLHLLLDGRRDLAQADSSPVGFEILLGDPLLGKPEDKQLQSNNHNEY